MPKIEIPAFTGLNLRAAPHLLRPGEATWAHDCVLDSGAIMALRGATTTAATVPVGTKAVHYWNGAAQWVSATTDRWYAEAGQYLYWADGGVPQKQKVGGAASRLGIVAPATAPTGIDTQYWNYNSNYWGYLTPTNGWDIVYTFYDPSTGAESAPSPAFTTKKGLFVLEGDINSSASSFSISALDPNDYFDADQPPNDWLVFKIDGEVVECAGATQTADTSSKRTWSLSGVSRGTAGTSSASHSKGTLVRLFTGDITLTGLEAPPAGMVRREYANVAGEYRRIESLWQEGWDGLSSPILTSDDHDPPPNLTGIVGPYNGMMFGWKGRALQWTKTGDFDAWPALQAFDDFPADITTCAIWGGYLVVFTAEGVYTVSGSDPEGLSRFKVQGTRGTIHPRSVANIGPGLLYVSAFGVEVFDGIASRSLSFDKLGDRVVLTNPRSAFLRGRAYIFHDGADLNGTAMVAGCLICDLRSGDPVWTTSGITTSLPYVLPLDDQMYIVSETNLVQWESGSARTWSYSTAILDAQDGRRGKVYSLLRLDAEGAITTTPKVNEAAGVGIATSGARAQHRMRLQSRRGERFTIDASGTGALYGVTLEYQ